MFEDLRRRWAEEIQAVHRQEQRMQVMKVCWHFCSKALQKKDLHTAQGLRGLHTITPRSPRLHP